MKGVSSARVDIEEYETNVKIFLVSSDDQSDVFSAALSEKTTSKVYGHYFSQTLATRPENACLDNHDSPFRLNLRIKNHKKCRGAVRYEKLVVLL